MANPNRPSGFTPVQYLNGAAWNGQARVYTIAANYATALYIGDPVISSGTAQAVTGIPDVTRAAGTAAVRGVIVGLGKYEGLIANPSNLDITYRPASDPALWYAMVADDPNIIFEIQEESGTTQMTVLDVGANQISVAGTGNGFISGWQVACTTTGAAGTTATLQLRLLGLARKSNNTFGAYAKWLVKINTHELGAGSVGVVGI